MGRLSFIANVLTTAAPRRLLAVAAVAAFGSGCSADDGQVDLRLGEGSTGYDDYDEDYDENYDRDLGGSSSTGEYCEPVEPDVECCLESCAAPARPLGPTEAFNCPVAGMDYNCGCAGTEFFDCDDYAYACEQWARNQGINLCTYGFWWRNPDGTRSGHAINIVEVDYAGPFEQYCFVEPQGNSTGPCWIQAAGEPNPPDWAQDQLCASWGGTCDGNDVTCDGEHSPYAGEACFTTNPQVCQRFQMETGLCPETFEPDYDCDVVDATGDHCYWSCGDDEMCGATCLQCDPVPEPELEYESCASINGNNEGCFWECDAGESCGDDCYTCW